MLLRYIFHLNISEDPVKKLVKKLFYSQKSSFIQNDADLYLVQIFQNVIPKVMIASVSRGTFLAGRRLTSPVFAKCPIKLGFYWTGDALQ